LISQQNSEFLSSKRHSEWWVALKKQAAIFFCKKMANEAARLHFTLLATCRISGNRKSSSLKTRGFLPCHGVMQ